MEVSRNQDFDTMHTAGIKALQIIPLIENQSCYDNVMSQYDWLGGISNILFSTKTMCFLKTSSCQLYQSMYTNSLGATTAFLFDKTTAIMHILELIYQYTQ